jgi:lysophospholipase
VQETVTFSWTSPEGQSSKLAIHWWKNKYGITLPPRGYVWLIHGIGEHGGRYAEFASFLTELGFDVLAPDHVGHGLSRKQGGVSAQLRSFKVMRSALNTSVKFWMLEGPAARAGAHGKPWYVVGHSLGALLTLSWILKARQEGFDLDFATAAFVTAAPLKLRMPVPAWKEFLAHKIGGLWPRLELKNDIALEYLSVEAANKAAYREDLLVHPYVSPELFLSMNEEAAYALSHSSDIEIPLGIGVGAEDPIVDPAALKSYYESLSTHKFFIEMAGMRHEILNDVNKRDLYKVIAEWFL